MYHYNQHCHEKKRHETRVEKLCPRSANTLVFFAKSARFQGAETKRWRPLLNANIPPIWWITCMFCAFATFGWVSANFEIWIILGRFPSSMHGQGPKNEIAPFSLCPLRSLEIIPSSGHYCQQKNSPRILLAHKSAKM